MINGCAIGAANVAQDVAGATTLDHTVVSGNSWLIYNQRASVLSSDRGAIADRIG
jgi:hypothetical protein